MIQGVPKTTIWFIWENFEHKEGFLCDTLYHNTLLCKTNPVPSYNKTVQQLRTFTS